MRADNTAPALIPVVGSGHPTMDALRWTAPSLTQAAPISPKADRGDGTVPYESGVPWELHGTMATSIVRRTYQLHSGLATNDARVGLKPILELLAGNDPPGRGVEEDTPHLGIGLRDIVTSGDIVHGEFAIGGRTTPNGSVRTSATWTPFGGAGPQQIEVERDFAESSAFRCTTPNEAGTLRVEVVGAFPDDRVVTVTDEVVAIPSEPREEAA